MASALARAGGAGRAAGARWRCSARWPNWARTPTSRTSGGRGGWPAELGVRSADRGRRAGPSDRRRRGRAAPTGPATRTGCRTTTRRSRRLRGAVAARRRGAGQGIPVGRPGAWSAAGAAEPPGQQRRSRRAMKTILIAALFGLLSSILCTPLVVKYFRRQGFGQEIRDDGPQIAPGQAGHADHGRGGDHGRHHRRLRRGAPDRLAAARLRPDRVRPAAAVPDARLRRGRLSRRLHQAAAPAQFGLAGPGQIPRPADGGAAVRRSAR